MFSTLLSHNYGNIYTLFSISFIIIFYKNLMKSSIRNQSSLNKQDCRAHQNHEKENLLLGKKGDAFNEELLNNGFKKTDENLRKPLIEEYYEKQEGIKGKIQDLVQMKKKIREEKYMMKMNGQKDENDMLMEETEKYEVLRNSLKDNQERRKELREKLKFLFEKIKSYDENMQFNSSQCHNLDEKALNDKKEIKLEIQTLQAKKDIVQKEYVQIQKQLEEKAKLIDKLQGELKTETDLSTETQTKEEKEWKESHNRKISAINDEIQFLNEKIDELWFEFNLKNEGKEKSLENKLNQN